MFPDSLLQRLKERKLVQWALAYLAGTWALVEATNLVVEQFHWPEIVGQVVTVVAFFGFFLTLVLAWYHGEKGYQHVRGPELLIIAVVLVVAGVTLSRVGGGEDVAAGPDGLEGLSELARFAAQGSDRPTIAVLPLANLSAKAENAYFAAGIHEEILRQLSLVRTLAVISRTSVLSYAEAGKSVRQIASELGARYIVEGSVQEDGGRVRIQAQLIDATNDEHLWAERYDRTLDDIFQLQSDVAEAIAGALQGAIAPDEQERIQTPPTQDRIAYDLYLRALDRNWYVREEWDAGVALLRRATARDAAFALAHAKLGSAFATGAIAHETATYDSALARAELAIRLDPDLPDGHYVRGFLLGDSGNRDEGQASLQRALSLNPSYSAAWGTLAAYGWWYSDYVAGALAGRQGAKVDPRSSYSPLQLANCLLYVGMYREAAGWYRRAIEVDASNIYALFGLAIRSFDAGDEAAGRGYIARMREAGADNPIVLAYAGLFEIQQGDLEAAADALSAIDPSALTASTNAFPTAEALLGWVEARTGRPGGRARLEALQRRRLEQVAAGRASLTGINDLSVIVSVLGGKEEQLRWFREAAQRNWARNYLFRDAPWFDDIRDHPDFQAWLRDAEGRMAEYQRELATLGPWMPEEVLGQPAAIGQGSQSSQ